jgi:hypothetical protein
MAAFSFSGKIKLYAPFAKESFPVSGKNSAKTEDANKAGIRWPAKKWLPPKGCAQHNNLLIYFLRGKPRSFLEASAASRSGLEG